MIRAAALETLRSENNGFRIRAAPQGVPCSRPRRLGLGENLELWVDGVSTSTVDFDASILGSAWSPLASSSDRLYSLSDSEPSRTTRLDRNPSALEPDVSSRPVYFLVGCSSRIWISDPDAAGLAFPTDHEADLGASQPVGSNAPKRTDERGAGPPGAPEPKPSPPSRSQARVPPRNRLSCDPPRLQREPHIPVAPNMQGPRARVNGNSTKYWGRLSV